MRIQDRERLEEIAALDLFAPEVRSLLQDIVEEAARELQLPISLVSIVLDEAQFFAASHGLHGWLSETQGTPIEWSFCANAVHRGEPFIVEDARSHADVQDNPLVSEDGIRCYAGIPLVSSRGFILGTLCVIGTEERTFSKEDLDRLRQLTTRAVERLEARRTEPGA